MEARPQDTYLGVRNGCSAPPGPRGHQGAFYTTRSGPGRGQVGPGSGTRVPALSPSGLPNRGPLGVPGGICPGATAWSRWRRSWCARRCTRAGRTGHPESLGPPSAAGRRRLAQQLLGPAGRPMWRGQVVVGGRARARVGTGPPGARRGAAGLGFPAVGPAGRQEGRRVAQRRSSGPDLPAQTRTGLPEGGGCRRTGSCCLLARLL